MRRTTKLAGRDPLTPLHRLPTGHSERRAEQVLRDRRLRRDARSTRRVRDRREEW